MNTAIILAGGAGARFGGREPKQFLKVAGRPLLAVCLERFQAHAGVDAIVLVCPQERLARAARIAAPFAKVAGVLPGGATRQESSAIGVGAVPANTARVLIHDAARALVGAALIGRVLAALKKECAVMPVVPAGDTTVRIDGDGSLAAVLDRNKLRRVQTPQGFRLEIIRRAHDMAQAEGFRDAGDDCSLILRYKLAPVATVDGDLTNIKVTYPEDLLLAEALMKKQKLYKGKR